MPTYPFVDGLIHAGFEAVLAYRAAYLSGVVLATAGFIVQNVLVFILIPKEKNTARCFPVNHREIHIPKISAAFS